MRAIVRQKLVRLIDQVVASRTGALREDLTRSFNRRIDERIDVAQTEILDAIRNFEVRQRRDIFFSWEVAAAHEAAEFVVSEMPTARPFGHPHDTLRFALEQVTLDGMALEFGVATGTTLRVIVDGLNKHDVFGFDVFTGLPENWRPGFPAGVFAQEQLPEVPGAELVVGLFNDTLPGFLDEHPGPIAFLHADADLYSATHDVLTLVADRIVPGTVVIFDEYINYNGWRNGEYRAWTEFVEATGTKFRYVGYTYDNEQVAVVVED